MNRWPDAVVISALISPLLTGCAMSALALAPDRPDSPWTPETKKSGEILPGGKSRAGGSNGGYVLPANREAATAAPPPTGLGGNHVYSLPELVGVALSNNPATRSAWNDARSAALAAGIAESAFLPVITANIVGGYQAQHERTSALGASISNDFTAKGVIAAVSLQWLLFDFGERSAIVEAAKQGSVVSDIEFSGVHQRVIYEVSLAFYAHASAEAHAAAAAKSLENAEEVQAAAEDRHAHGIGTAVEVAQARQGAAQARLQQVQATGAAQNAYLNLISGMGISPLTRIRIADVSGRKLSPATGDSVERIVFDAVARRPDVLAAYAAERASLANVRAARAEFWPKLFLSATGSYAEGGLAVTAIPSFSQQLPTLNLTGNGLGVTLLAGVAMPLYDGDTRGARLEQTLARADNAEAALIRIRNEAVRQIVLAENTLLTSLSACEASTALVSAAQTTFDAAFAAYRSGMGSITDLILADTQLLQAENAQSDAYSTSLSAAAALAFATGSLGSSP